MELITSRLLLREFVEGDYQALRDVDSRPAMHTYERDLPGEAETRKSLDEFIKAQHEVPRTTFKFAITIPPHKTVRGILKLSQQWEVVREWEVGWAIHPDEWGKGYAGEAARQAMDWAFKHLNAHRIVAFCHADNSASVRVMEKLGMHQDGRLRETRWLNGRWWDEFVYSILEREWKNLNYL